MASSLSHSNSNNSLSVPAGSSNAYRQQRRMTSPSSMPPRPSSLNLPEPVYGHPSSPRRPPSPLRNTFTDEDDDEDEDEDDRDRTWGRKSHSPSSSVSQLAATFAQRVGSLVQTMSPQRGGSALPTDAEIEAEAERERDRGRREAERILTQEAEERRLVEERVLAMMNSTRSSPRSIPPPTRSQTLPNAPSPSGSQKEGGGSWWSAAKNKLTPTKEKEPLTPAQQIILETKAREKMEKKNGKSKEKDKEKEKDKDKEWAASSLSKYNDPAFLNLAIPSAPVPRHPSQMSPSSPTPSRPISSNAPPVLTPSPLRSGEQRASSSPSREAPPIYAQFNGQGTLDVHGTLLIIAKRFEKLEKWTVGHVRALEERMSDVERWLVDKEREKEEASQKTKPSTGESPTEVNKELNEMREEVAELQGRVGELGREMAKLATAPTNLSSGPARQTAPVSTAPPTSPEIVVHSQPSSLPSNAYSGHHTPRIPSSTARDSTSPPLSSSGQAGTSRTRLPYPTGDYATPPDTVILSSQGFFSPTNSPPSSITSATRSRSISGLPNTLSTPQSATSSGLPRTTSPPARVVSPTPSSGLPPPKTISPRPSSVSPTPRKRYTVALGAPITGPPRPQSSIGTAFFSSPQSEGDDDDDFQDETIGKSASAKLNASLATTEDETPQSGLTRTRPQSMYNSQPLQANSLITPLKPRFRSRSTVGLGITDSSAPVTPITGKFVDPLLLRKQEKEASTTNNTVAVKAAAGKGKIPIGQLVAFFDGEKKGE